MRDACVQVLMDIARQDKRVMLLTGDLGFKVLTPFAATFPDQFLNVGVAEQNMTGVATGLALEGKIVFTYSIGNFPTLRCLEQIRNDVCYHNANVKIVCIGGGFCYGPLGISHHATEDLAIMRVLPQMQVMAPGDLTETRLVTRMAYETHGPCYLRLGRGGEPDIHLKPIHFSWGQGIPLFPQGDVALLSTGGILINAVRAREMLENQGISASLHSLPFLQPLDMGLLEELARTSRLVVTIEEHSIIGGLGGAVAEVLAEFLGPKAPLVRLGLREGFSCEVGDQEYLREIYGLSPGAIVRRVKEVLSIIQPEAKNNGVSD
ncbi:MAG: transketolase [Deltaproteobacteria bacterium]|nr:transketolase [Deltaproteobacteria bacterium]